MAADKNERKEDKETRRPTERTDDDKSPHGSERDADAQRPGGPRYHGAGWERADEEEQRGEPVAAPRADDPVRVNPGQVPGATGDESKEPDPKGGRGAA